MATQAYRLDIPAYMLDSAAPDDGQLYLTCGCALCLAGAKNYTAFSDDLVGARPAPTAQALAAAAAIADVEAGDKNTTLTVKVDGEHYIGTVNAPNDEDFFRVELVAGKTYNIGQYLVTDGAARGGSGVALADAYLELYASDGTTLLSQADGGGPNTPSGLDALLTFTAETTGTYYINARSYDNAANNGDNGDFVGDYELFVDEIDPADAPLPRFYDNDELLASLDWGSQWNRTSRNPDGDNGTRTDNGVPNGGAAITDSLYGVTGKNVLTFYFAKQGDIFTSEDLLQPGLENTLQARDLKGWEKEAFFNMFAEYEKVADLEFRQVSSREDADIKLIVYNGTPGVGPSVLGRMSPPGEQNEGQMEINGGDVRWTEAGVKPGGFYFPTLLHELGHGMGMKHPHDNGGGGPTMRGATAGEGQVIGGAYGDFGLSQGIYTMMSYNDGWDETGQTGGRPAGHGGPRTSGITGTDHFGHVGTMAALDIAVIQDKYGVNEEYRTGNDVYTIADENGPGVFYSAIWDGGGTDMIKYVGERDATIDLRPATLKYEEGGGGRVSFALGAWSGFTIANGVTIENASTGAGDDTLVGNDANNRLSGGAGVDSLSGASGDDVLVGGLGNDVLSGGGGRDTADYRDATGTVTVNLAIGAARGAAGVDRLSSIENVRGSEFKDVLVGNDAANILTGGGGNDALTGGGNKDQLFGGLGSDILNGGTGNDVLVGNEGNDQLIGGAGSDRLTGGEGADRFVFARLEGPDVITDFNAEDVLVFKASSFGLAAGALASSKLQFGPDATGSTGVFLYDAGRRQLSWDPDGAGASAAEVLLRFSTPETLTTADFLLI
jgi:Ca2+-binding RTX toxin-like protein